MPALFDLWDRDNLSTKDACFNPMHIWPSRYGQPLYKGQNSLPVESLVLRFHNEPCTQAVSRVISVLGSIESMATPTILKIRRRTVDKLSIAIYKQADILSQCKTLIISEFEDPRSVEGRKGVWTNPWQKPAHCQADTRWAVLTHRSLKKRAVLALLSSGCWIWTWDTPHGLMLLCMWQQWGSKAMASKQVNCIHTTSAFNTQVSYCTKLYTYYIQYKIWGEQE